MGQDTHPFSDVSNWYSQEDNADSTTIIREWENPISDCRIQVKKYEHPFTTAVAFTVHAKNGVRNSSGRVASDATSSGSSEEWEQLGADVPTLSKALQKAADWAKAHNE